MSDESGSGSASSSASSRSVSSRSSTASSSGSGSGSESGSGSGSETYDEVPEEFEEELDTEASEGFRELMSQYAINFDEEPIGHGAFSIVRLGYTRKPPVERVAVKIVPVRFAKDVLKEAHTMMNLNHSSVLHMRGVFVGEKNVYLVTDYAAGGELFSYIRDHGWLPEETVAVIARKLLEGIKYLHDRGIVHRDLKPQNVLCATDDPTDIRIADFGLSKILSEDTMLKTCCGSPHYLAPEVLQCSAYDSKVDIWGIGIIVYIALTGCLPFFDDDMRKLIVKIMTADYTWPDDVVVSDAGLFSFPLSITVIIQGLHFICGFFSFHTTQPRISCGRRWRRTRQSGCAWQTVWCTRGSDGSGERSAGPSCSSARPRRSDARPAMEPVSTPVHYTEFFLKKTRASTTHTHTPTAITHSRVSTAAAAATTTRTIIY